MRVTLELISYRGNLDKPFQVQLLIGNKLKFMEQLKLLKNDIVYGVLNENDVKNKF